MNGPDYRPAYWFEELSDGELLNRLVNVAHLSPGAAADAVARRDEIADDINLLLDD